MESESAVSAESRTDDGFGLLPFAFAPGLIPGLLGACRFILQPGHLELPDAQPPERIPYDAFRAVEADGRTIRLDVAPPPCQRVISLRLGSRDEAERVASLIERLVEESRQMGDLLAGTLASKEIGRLLDTCLGFRGQPYVAAADVLLATATRTGVSDVHLEPLSDRIRVTVRAARELVEAGSYRKSGHEGLSARLKYLAGCHSHRSGIAQEGAWSLADGAGEARLSIFPALDGERVALRLIRPIAFPDLPSLGWPAAVIEEWRELLRRGPGLSLIVGPIGSGKTTALYATLAELAAPGPRGAKRVATLEDPVEGRVPGICQSSLTPDAGTSLDTAFKHLLRQDPDVMALGEIRDAASLREALQAGQAGHLVLATFHAADADGAIERLGRLGLEPHLVTTALRGILTVRLEKGMQPTASLRSSATGTTA
ncbi:MAG TPA: ATPase, T2SS/T4P/T4SS family [Candidatus Ozemobacteraceae bacterium]|nr:ATPase, T2SS/T4P/T4SS family [Candidatus Ozemobacteraceae bacterium]